MNFCVKECSFIIISLFIFVIYFVQYVWIALELRSIEYFYFQTTNEQHIY
jgi:hypothetical protein